MPPGNVEFTAAQFAVLSRLSDEAEALPPSERLTWARGLADIDTPVRAALLRMLERGGPEAGTVAGDDFLRFTSAQRLVLTMPEVALPASAALVGPYRLRREIGSGGMGVVWEAERVDGMMRRTVAVKLPHPWLVSRQVIRRFERERDILASLEHPNIARLYDAGVTENGQPFLARELVEGQPTTTWCDQRLLSLKERLALMQQGAAGSAACASARHRAP